MSISRVIPIPETQRPMANRAMIQTGSNAGILMLSISNIRLAVSRQDEV